MVNYRTYGILITIPYLLLTITFHIRLQTYEKTPIAMVNNHSNRKVPKHSQETNVHKDYLNSIHSSSNNYSGQEKQINYNKERNSLQNDVILYKHLNNGGLRADKYLEQPNVTVVSTHYNLNVQKGQDINHMPVRHRQGDNYHSSRAKGQISKAPGYGDVLNGGFSHEKINNRLSEPVAYKDSILNSKGKYQYKPSKGHIRVKQNGINAGGLIRLLKTPSENKAHLRDQGKKAGDALLQKDANRNRVNGKREKASDVENSITLVSYIGGGDNKDNKPTLQVDEESIHLNGMQISDAPWITEGSINYPILKHCPLENTNSTNQFHVISGSYFYAAYVDMRMHKRHIVRIITVLKSLNKPQIYCHFRYHNSEAYEVTVAKYYEMCENHGKPFGGWILSCDLPHHMTANPPCSVLLATQKSLANTKSIAEIQLYSTLSKHSYELPHNNTQLHRNDKGLNHIRSQNPQQINETFQPNDNKSSKPTFSICVPPLFGYIPSTTLIEFIELNKLLGADHITFYSQQVSGEIQRVLDYYLKNQSFISVIPWKLSLTDNDIWYHGQLVAINDCLYRSMHKFDYVAFNDVDEFIVPKFGGAARTWPEMINLLDKNSNNTQYSGYSFQSAFFDPLSSSSRMLYDLESDLRSKSFSRVRSKVMAIPSRIHELGIHHISHPILDMYKIYYTNTTEAYIHHYRQCMTDFDPKMNCRVFARDESLLYYIPQLRHNVHKITWELKEIQKQLRDNTRGANRISIHHL